MTKRVLKKKALLLDTAVRNPERFPAFLSALKQFEGTIFDEDIARQIAISLIKTREYNPQKALKTVPSLHKYLKNEDEMTDEDATLAMEWALDNLKGHSAKGFPKRSWGGRVVEWFALMQELGAVRLNKGEKISFSKSGNDMVRVYSDESVHNPDALIANFWLNGMMKLQPKSPFRSGIIENRPFILMLKSIVRLKNLNGKDDPGLSRSEISFLLNWNGSDEEEFVDFILDVRDKYGKQLSSDLVYDLVMHSEKMLSGESNTRFKKAQIVTEIVDDWMRKSRMTGIIQLRGLGRYLSILSEEMDKAKYIIENYDVFNDEPDEDKYFTAIANLDENVAFIETEKVTDHVDAKAKRINSIADDISWKDLIHEFKVLGGGKLSSNNDIFKLIRDPLRLEFLSAIAMRKAFPDSNIEANYSADDEGLPKSTAIGDIPDLFIKELSTGATIEVTLQTGKQQAVAEIPAISRHLKAMQERDNRDDYFSVFSAKTLHSDSIDLSQFYYFRDKMVISTYTVDDFAEKLSKVNKLEELKVLP
ncbi:hypothetical protein AKUH4B402J_UNKNOWN100090 (plasmid) [Apilactobacillus kunkeei]|nr:hypothetical protein AKUH4B402J_UNKNOWN100090 [Apilactobacillus kunkeei]